MVECFCGCGRSVSLRRRSANALGTRVAGQHEDWEILLAATEVGSEAIEGLEARLEESRWVHANLQAFVHQEPVAPGFSKREAARWLSSSERSRFVFGRKVLQHGMGELRRLERNKPGVGAKARVWIARWRASSVRSRLHVR
jgi:hypothetical protein